MSIQKRLYKYLCICIGISVGATIISVIIIAFPSLLGTRCASINGRICNNAGTCNEDGVCECNPQFTGTACETTTCEGYDELFGTTCFGRGLCLPPDPTLIPSFCQVQKPSAANGYIATGLGLADPRCKAYTLNVRNKMDAGTATDTELGSIPTCACHSPYGGRSCLLNMCPVSASFAICGGHGNASVGYTNNQTTTGTGCQCSTFVSLRTMIQTLPIAYLEMVRTRYLHDFTQGFCGTPHMVNSGKTLVFIQSNSDIKCYCDEMHYGTTCEYGVCPDVEGVFCGGHGHTGLGFGVEVNTTVRVRPNECTPNCRGEGTALCHGRCDNSASCRAKQHSCPPSTPYRCPSSECVSGDQQQCDAGFISGYWDDVNSPNLVHSINCTSHQLARDISPVRSMARMLRCFGSDATLIGRFKGVSAAGVTTLSGSRLLSIYLRTVGNGSATLSYRGTNYTVVSPHYTRIEIPRGEQYSPDSYGTVTSVITKMATTGLVKVWPCPAFYLSGTIPETVQLILPPNSIVLKPLSMSVTEEPDRTTADYAIVMIADDLALTTEGRVVPFTTCANAWITCIWYITVPGVFTNSAGTSACEWTQSCPPPAIRYVSVRMIAEINSQVWDAWAEIESDGWNMHVPSPLYESRELRFFPSATTAFTEITFLLENDLVRPCICQSWGKTKTEFGALYLTQVSRPDVQQVGEYGVGIAVGTDGTQRQVRGPVITVNPYLTLNDSLSHSAVRIYGGRAKSMSMREYNLGTVTCDDSVYPTRCNDGSCSRVLHVAVSGVRETCECELSKELGMQCTCTDTFGTVEICTGQESCAILHGGVGVDTLQYCLWSPLRETPLPVSGFNRLRARDDVYLSLDSGTMPILFVLSGCNETLTTDNRATLVSTCMPGDELHIRMVHQLDIHRDEWVVYASASPRTIFYSNYGGVSVFAWNHTVYTSSSSSPETAETVVDTGFSYWKADWDDTSAFIRHDFTAPTRLVSVYIDLVDVGLETAFANVTFPVSVMIQGLPTGGREDWTTLSKITEMVMNGTTTIYTVPILHDVPLAAVRLFAHFPFAVRSFIPFTDQNCTAGRLTGTIPNITTRLMEFQASPPSLFTDCVCDDSCVLDGNDVGGDGVCSDATHLNVVGAIPGVDVCADGTDCTDCGTSKWSVDGSKSCATDPYVATLLNRYKDFCAFSEMDHVWTIEEYLWFGPANLTFSFTWENKTTMRWTKPECIHECPLHRCEDGTCSNDPFNCPVTTYQCKGNGCVRADINLREYKCACARGRGGADCSLHQCTPGDPETGAIDPHKWCTCSGPSPLKIRPPYNLVWGGTRKTYFTDEQVLSVNRPSNHRSNSRDVGWVNVYADKAPYGIAFLRKYSRGNTTFYTNCPYRAKTASGLFLELEECVSRRNLNWPHEVEEWRTLAGGETAPVWEYETQYDDSPYRCPAGHCVANERDCYTASLITPMCGGGNSKCMVDGTCVCEFGKQTFVVTDHLTNLVSVAYYHTVDGITNPVHWGTPNDNRFVDIMCKARNCSEVDCSPPIGCFPGTAAFGFVDRQFECQDPLPNAGKCVVDIHDCKNGHVSEPLICSGNGEVRKRDYRQEEYYCECGNYDDSRGGVFKSNGFGGTSCQDYFCQDDPKRIFFSRSHPHTIEPYKDINGYVLPGKWIGPCGATVGANPDDIAEWSLCCPGIPQLEMCSMVPCIIGGVSSCVPIDQCMGYARTPKVYVCNGKGKALADGTCDCNKDQETGIGYVYDLSVYSTKGCSKKVSCPTSPVSNRICNAYPACNSFEKWGNLFDFKYFSQQAIVLAAREGLPLTNRSICERLINPNELTSLIIQALYNEAIFVQSEQNVVASDICIMSANENSSAPLGMVPYYGREDYVGSYMQPLKVPYYINDTTVTGAPWLTDQHYAADKNVYTSYPSSVTRYSTLNQVTIQMHTDIFIDVLRFHVYATSTIYLRFTGNTAVPVCQDLRVRGYNDYQWVTVFCMPSYRAYDFQLEQPDLWNVHCLGDETSTFCEQWMQSTCMSITGGVVQLPSSLEYYNGCTLTARCCITVVARLASTPYVTVHTVSGVNFDVDEIVVYGHRNTSVPLPSGLAAMIYAATNQSECVDEGLFINGDLGLGNQGSYFRQSGTTRQSFQTALTACQTDGGVLATAVGEVSLASGYAAAMGAACFSGGNTAVGCLMNARDRNEVTNPSTMEKLFDNYCTTYGCFMYDVLSGVTSRSYQSDPEDGAQWQSPWAAGQMSWTAFFNTLINHYNSQRSMSYTWYYYAKSPTPPSPAPAPTIAPSTPYSNAFSALPTKAVTVQYTSPNPALVPGDFTNPADGAYFDIWNTMEMCTITFYSTPNCGMWSDWAETCNGDHSRWIDCAVSGYAKSDSYHGAKKEYFITPANYEQYIGIDLMTLPLGERTFTTNVPTDLDSVDSNHVGQSIAYARSWSIKGKCGLQLAGTTSAGYYSFAVSSHTRVGSAANYQDMNPTQTCNGLNQYCGGSVQASINTQTNYAEPGCFPQIYPKSKKYVTDKVSPQFPIRDGTDNVGGPAPGYDGPGLTCAQCTHPDYIRDTTHVIGSILILPFFESGKMRTWMMTEGGNSYFGTDSFTMGWIHNVYMCSAIQVMRVLSIVNAATYNYPLQSIPVMLKTEAYTLVANRAVIPISVPYWVYGADTGCTTSISSGCGVSTPFVTCDGSLAAPRVVMQCTACYNTQPTAQYKWSQEFVYGTNFVDDVTAVNQTDPSGGVAVIPSLFVDWTGWDGSAITSHARVRYDSLPSTSRHYVRLTASLTAAQYLTKYELDSCLAVVKTASPAFPYMLTPVVCTSASYFALCVRDTLKYAVKAGTQCDACGPKSRVQVVAPGETAFSLRPLADPVLNPRGHAILTAYNEGQLESIINQDMDALPWDVIRAGIPDSSYIFAFPEARDFFIRGVSTRPGYTTPGETADVNTWIDMDLHHIFPYECGQVKNVYTGILERKCAASKSHCLLPTGDYREMALIDMPSILTGAHLGNDLTTEPECGMYIDPSSFHRYDDWGGPQPSNGGFQVIANAPLVLKVQSPNTTWTNTGKKVRADLVSPNGFSLYGTVKSSVTKGQFRLWIAPASPIYAYAVDKQYITEWTAIRNGENGIHLYSVPAASPHATVMGYDFIGLQIGSQLTLSKLLVTTNETTGLCQGLHFPRYVEPSSSIVSNAPLNQCRFILNTEEELDGADVGICSCDPDGPTDGPSCDWETTRSNMGKRICGGYGDNGGMELTSSLTTTHIISPFGVYLDQNHYSCKCINPGLMIRTILRPASAFDYAFIIRNDRLPNADLFIEVTNFPSTISRPVRAENAEQVCNTESAVLPSWETGDEIDQLLILLGQVEPIFTDLAYDPDHTLMTWKQRGEVVSVVPPSLNSTTGVDVCATSSLATCIAANYNNLAFNSTGIFTLTDGKTTIHTFTAAITITLRTGNTDITVEVHGSDLTDELVLKTQAAATCTPITQTATTNTYDCLYPNVTSVALSHGFGDAMYISEVCAYLKLDGGRVPGLFT